MTADEFHQLKVGDVIRYDYLRDRKNADKDAHTIEVVMRTVSHGLIQTMVIYHLTGLPAETREKTGSTLQIHTDECDKMELIK